MSIQSNLTWRCFWQVVAIATLLMVGAGLCGEMVGILYAQSVERLADRIEENRDRVEANLRDLLGHQHPDLVTRMKDIEGRVEEHDEWLAKLNGGAIVIGLIVAILELLNLTGVRIKIGRKPAVRKPTSES